MTLRRVVRKKKKKKKKKRKYAPCLKIPLNLSWFLANCAPILKGWFGHLYTHTHANISYLRLFYTITTYMSMHALHIYRNASHPSIHPSVYPDAFCFGARDFILFSRNVYSARQFYCIWNKCHAHTLVQFGSLHSIKQSRYGIRSGKNQLHTSIYPYYILLNNICRIYLSVCIHMSPRTN